jgi:DNA-directed RNA polymerase subunit K/omega
LYIHTDNNMATKKVIEVEKINEENTDDDESIIQTDDEDDVSVEAESDAETDEDVTTADKDTEEAVEEVDPEKEEEEESEQEEEIDPEKEEDSAAEEEEGVIKKTERKKRTKKTVVSNIGIENLKTNRTAQSVNFDEDEDDDEADDEADTNYLQKFDNKMRENFIINHHPEARTHNYEEVKALTRVTRDSRGIINDPLHKTIPFLTKYEMTRVIGQRAKQLDSGARAFVKIPLNVIDGYHIAMLELEQKKLPFIIKRPYPNGGVEYWNVSDLEILI